MNVSRMKTVILGCGNISDAYLSTVTKRFRILDVFGCCNRTREKAVQKAEQYGIRALTTEEMLSDPSIELVINLTPAAAHYATNKMLLQAGKHVYTEKTLAVELEEAAELVALADEKNLCLGVAPDTFLGEAYQTGRRAIEEGLIGEVTSFSITCNRCYDLLLCFFPIIRVPGNGILYDYLVYYITALVSLLGPVREVVELIRQYDWSGQRRVSFEYTMFAGWNDTKHHADALIRMLRGLECRVNLIRFHKIPSFPYESSSAQVMEAFRDRLVSNGITCTVRASRGEDIFAACGLLAGQIENIEVNYLHNEENSHYYD